MASYYTDGSVDVDGSAGAAFVCGDHIEQWRISSGVSAYQAELVAILCALQHARQHPRRRIVVNSGLGWEYMSMSNRHGQGL